MYGITGKTRFGWISVISTGHGIARLRFLEEGRDSRNTADDVSRETWAQIEAWCDGERQGFDLPLEHTVSASLGRWLDVLRTIPYGETVSYGEFARLGGKPQAPRAAGSACARNPVPLIIPCHRVTRHDGSLGNFGGIEGLSPKDPRNLALKQALIDHESRIRSIAA